ncbi:MAG: hypothetical protein PHC28_15890 [Flavobacterium sp.]|uniref:hypothetical protein n=1 Tax=Flavobacterium sp. TaxID=239 RepID=UPI002629194A|nr:hypothetical protein [Flavobacterium sp.]MDD5151934.1 hypothetical protein [Flavobacterium sp.]
MKKILSKSYITLFFLLTGFITFAQTPGSNDTGGDLEGGDAPATPIDDYLWVLALAGLILVFLTFKSIQKNKIQE